MYTICCSIVKLNLPLMSTILQQHYILPYLHQPTIYQFCFYTAIDNLKCFLLNIGERSLVQIVRSHVMGHNLNVLFNVANSLGMIDPVPILETGFVNFLAENKDIVFGTSVTLELLSHASAAFFAPILGAGITRPHVISDAWFDILVASADYACRLDDALINRHDEVEG